MRYVYRLEGREAVRVAPAALLREHPRLIELRDKMISNRAALERHGALHCELKSENLEGWIARCTIAD